MAKIVIDGKEIAARPGAMLLPTALENGVFIPHYCYHPKLSIDGSCRLCLVKVEGLPKLTIACNTPVRDGMVVDTRCEEVEHARRGVLELLLVNHPLDCPICDQAGECYLQDYSFEFGIKAGRSKEVRRKLLKRVDLGPRIVFDQERCILCRRCVRFCREIPKTSELGVFGLGDGSYVDVFPGTSLANDYSVCTADICPVGALLSKDFHHRLRVWFLEETETVCPGCARGCNVRLGTYRNRAYRMLPRRNDAVNETWMCDEGRDTYKIVNHPERLRKPLLRRNGTLVEVEWEEALTQAASLLGQAARRHGPGAVAAVGSAHLTNEESFIFAKLVRLGLGSSNLDLAVRLGREDSILIKAEKAINGRGARQVGVSPGPGGLNLAGIGSALVQGTLRALYIVGGDAVHSWSPEALERLEELEALVVQDLFLTPIGERAKVVLPGLSFAEKEGTVTNFAGRLQRLRRAVDPEGQPSDGDIFFALGRLLGVEVAPGSWDAGLVFSEMAASVAVFEGLSFESVGPLGIELAVEHG